MLYIFHGIDTEKAREKVHTLIDSLLTKNKDASSFRLEAADTTTDRLLEYAESQGLFAHKYIVFLDHPLETTESADAFTALRKEINESENIFIALLGPTTKTVLKKFVSHTEKIVEVGGTKKGSTHNQFNIFTLTDALGARAHGTLWVLYQRALRAGKAPEEIHGVLWWQVKAMLLAARNTDAETAGLKPFVYTKSRKFAANFSMEELHTLAHLFVTTYHSARRGEDNFETALERCILSV